MIVTETGNFSLQSLSIKASQESFNLLNKFQNLIRNLEERAGRREPAVWNSKANAKRGQRNIPPGLGSAKLRHFVTTAVMSNFLPCVCVFIHMYTCVGVCAFVYVCVRIKHICGDQRTALGVDIMVPSTC